MYKWHWKYFIILNSYKTPIEMSKLSYKFLINGSIEKWLAHLYKAFGMGYIIPQLAIVDSAVHFSRVDEWFQVHLGS